MLGNQPTRTASRALRTDFGEFQLHGFAERITRQDHAALTRGDLSGDGAVLARIHSEWLTGDAFGSLHCDCGAQLKAAMKAVADEGRGVILYFRQEGRGIGLLNKIRAYDLQNAGADTVNVNRLLGLPDDAHSHEVAARIFGMLKVSSVRLMTNNPAKVEAHSALGIRVSERVSHMAGHSPHKRSCLCTKRLRLGHLIG